jgi:hypothetical protein
MATGTYISTSDVEDHYGVQSIAVWSNLDNDDAAANDSRVEAAINWAEQSVEDRLRDGRYQVPLSGTSGTLHTVKNWCAELAGWWLWSSRGITDDEDGQAMERRRELVDAEIDAYAAGIRKLAAAKTEDGTPFSPVVIR